MPVAQRQRQVRPQQAWLAMEQRRWQLSAEHASMIALCMVAAAATALAVCALVALQRSQQSGSAGWMLEPPPPQPGWHTEVCGNAPEQSAWRAK